MTTLAELRAAVDAGTATPDLWEAALADYEALAARPSPESLQEAQAAQQTALQQFQDSQALQVSLQAQIATLQTEHAQGLARLKSTLATAHNIPEQLLSGTSVAELDASITSARSLVDQIADGIRRSQAAAVPNGAPGRTPPDLSSMSPVEKIRHGLAQANSH